MCIRTPEPLSTWLWRVRIVLARACGGRLAAAGAWAGGSVVPAAPQSPGTVPAPCRFSPWQWEQSRGFPLPGQQLCAVQSASTTQFTLLRCSCPWETLFLPQSVTGNGSESGSVETRGSHKGEWLNALVRM